MNEPWFQDGLKFTCTGCGDCCTGEPGYVWVNKAEIAALAAAVDLTVEEFERRYVRTVGIRKSLIELANGDCVFFDNQAPDVPGLRSAASPVPHLAFLAVESRFADGLGSDRGALSRLQYRPTGSLGNDLGSIGGRACLTDGDDPSGMRKIHLGFSTIIEKS